MFQSTWKFLYQVLYLRRSNFRIFPNLLDCINQGSSSFGVKQLDEADRLIKGRTGQLDHAFHIAVSFYIMDDLVNKGNLLWVEGLVVDKLGESLGHSQILCKVQ